MIHVIVDGYNMIRQVGALARYEKVSLEKGRQKLIQILAQYKKIKRHKVTVIFDGVLNLKENALSDFGPAYKEAGIFVRFSSSGVSADDVIRDMMREEKERCLVVSSDQSIIVYAKRYGAAYIPSPSFYKRLQQALMMGDMDKEAPPEKRARAHKRWQTCKKGPSRRTPKRERRNKGKVRKL